MPGHDEIGRHEPAAAAQEAADQRSCDAERRVRHYPERPAWKPEITRVDLHHGDADAGKPVSELTGPTRVELDRDDMRAGANEWAGERAGAGANIENEIAGVDPGCGNEALSPVVSELMPSPARPRFGGHDAPSPSSRQE
jgi:hypothetical protein